MSVQRITEAIEKLGAISSKVKGNFEGLDSAKLNMKITPQSWSIGQCIDHLTVSNRSYFPQLKAAASGTLQPGIWGKVPLLPGLFGKMLVKSVSPDEKKKFKTMNPFEPSYSDLDPGVISSFLDTQDELTGLISNLSRTDFRKTIITSPASGIITYSLDDLLDIITLHEERHYRQAMRTAEHFKML
ncbi:MAG: DinB family protein [Ignavibacteria bacterium]|nr:DinB family protein [Ignavibacteria bacterium]